MTLSEELSWRGFIKQTTLDDISKLDSTKFNFYLGVDPSAPSLTIGNLAAMLLVRQLLKNGHKGYLLVGGATGLIGDPDGKSDERQLMTPEEIEKNKRAIVAQYKTVLKGYDFKVVDNYDWFKDFGYLEFLRDIGKHVPMRQMLAREFVQSRLSESGSGISYAEFSYVLIQAYDFVHLNRQYGVNLQLCGSDQWGNSIAGVDLNRRINSAETHVLSMPLIVDKTTGRKFGKSEDGAVWLDAGMTSVYKFYQFWLNVDDDSAEDYLKIYTELDKPQIDEISRRSRQNPQDRPAQKRLAYEVTTLVHGQDAADAALSATATLFGDKSYAELNEADFGLLAAELPTVTGKPGDELLSILAASPLAASNSDARRLLDQGSIHLNGQKAAANRRLTEADFILGKHAILRRGKNLSILLTKAD